MSQSKKKIASFYAMLNVHRKIKMLNMLTVCTNGMQKGKAKKTQR